jgi:hypothetical protein
MISAAREVAKLLAEFFKGVGGKKREREGKTKD